MPRRLRKPVPAYLEWIDNVSSPFRLAATMALKSDCKYKVGACITKSGRIIAAGFNQSKSHPMIREFTNPLIMGLHAEVHATLGVPRHLLTRSVIHVVRLRRDGEVGIARPCIDCEGFLRKNGIKRAIYTLTYGDIEDMRI